ncbi:hypothetical protein ARMSODRAFT_1027211 [Armillaria solidipes]|uniref:Uncharacterized protein n=1 Tax=Armillaria solidipes TaxID=1076256 RepID=A0A2H3ALC5_9AGAR|nr:hypothetical protein ARMSODRAFT_1027211 [Armillaria solidipes]
MPREALGRIEGMDQVDALLVFAVNATATFLLQPSARWFSRPLNLTRFSRIFAPHYLIRWLMHQLLVQSHYGPVRGPDKTEDPTTRYVSGPFPMDYRNAIKWYQYDPMKWFIWSMQNIGLASHVKVFLENEVRQGQLTMQLKHLRETQESLAWPSNSDDLPVVSFDSLADVRPLNAAHNLLAMKRVGVLHGRHPHILDIAKRVPPCQRLKITQYNKLSSNYARSPSIHAHPMSIFPSFLTFTMASQDLAAMYHTSFNIPGADTILSSLDGILYRLPSSVFRRSTKFFTSNSFTFDNKPIPIDEHDVVVERLLWILSDLAISL